MKHKNYIFPLVLALFTTVTAWAQTCPGPSVRTALINLQRANPTMGSITTNGDRAGQVGITDTCGNQRYQYYVRVLDTCVNYNPMLALGNLPVSSFVYQCGSQDSLFYIDWTGDAIFLGAANDTAAFRNWYTYNDTTTDLGRTAWILRSAYWRGLDSAGIIRHTMRPDLFNGTESTLYQDSLVLEYTNATAIRNYFTLADTGIIISTTGDEARSVNVRTDTVNWSSSFAPTIQRHNLLADRTYFYADSLKVVGIGQFPAFPNLNFDGTEKGLFIDNSNNGVLLTNGDGTSGSTNSFLATQNSFNINSENLTSSNGIFINGSNNTNSVFLNTGIVYSGSAYGTIGFQSRSQQTLNEEILGLFHGNKDSNVRATNYLGYGSTGSTLSRYIGRAWGIQTLIGSNGYDWMQCIIPNDTLGNQVSMYNRAYYFPNDRPSPTLGDTSVIVWIGDGTTAGKNPEFVPFPTPASSVNWYNSNGSTTDNTRVATVTETATWLSTDILADGVYPFRFEISGSPENEPEALTIVFNNTEKDSINWRKSDQEIFQFSNAPMVLQSNEYITLQADSVVVENNSMAEKTKARYIIAGTPNNTTLQKIDANDANAGDFLISDGTDWVISSASSQGYFMNGGNAFAAAAILGTNDDNSLSLETNNVTRATVTSGATTGGQWTMTNVTANTNTVSDVMTLQTNSTGTAAASFGGGILFQGESSTTDNRDMVRLSAIWTTATDASRASALVFESVTGGGAIAERFRLSSVGITNAASFTLGNSSQNVTIGGSSGAVTINTSSVATITSTSSSAGAIALNATANGGSNAANILINSGTTFTQTGGTRNLMHFAYGFAPTSGTAIHNQLVFDGTFNQTGGANGITRGIYLNQTLTAVADFRAIEIAADETDAKGIYQTGSNTKNTFVGATGFGSTTAPTDKVEITGNLALLAAGNKIKIATGSNASVGTSAAMTAGTITINTTAVTANSQIFLTHASVGGTQGILSVGTITAGTSFVINSSSATDTGTVNWLIIN